MIIDNKGQFLLLSTAILIISMLATFEYIYTSSETSSVLFQPSFSEDATNLFRAINDRTDYFEEQWYNFSTFQAKRKYTQVVSPTASFNITVNCTQVTVTNLSNIKNDLVKIQDITRNYCIVKILDTDFFGGYIYYTIDNDTIIRDIVNITIGDEISPFYYRGSQLRGKLCDHLSNIYSDKEIQLECAIY